MMEEEGLRGLNFHIQNNSYNSVTFEERRKGTAIMGFATETKSQRKTETRITLGAYWLGTISGSHCPGSVWCPGNVEKKAGVGSSSCLCLNLLFPITIKLAEAAEMTFGGSFN